MLKAGGETEKVGNQYEFNIVTLYYAKLLCDEVLYVQSESYDSAIAQGLDIRVLTKDNKIHAIQAKSRNGLDDKWTISKLKQYSVIKNACHHILNGSTFILVSPLSYSLLSDWCRQAKAFNDIEYFEKNIITKTAHQEFQELLAEIKSYWNDSNRNILDFFKFFHIETIPDNKQYIINALSGEAHIIQAEQAYELLDHYPTKHNKIAISVYVSEIRNFLEKNNITFYIIDKPAASNALSDLQNKFINNLKRGLINNNWIERQEYKELRRILNAGNVAIISGNAGTGKSGIIYKLCTDLKSNNSIFLPLSFEVNRPNNNLHEYGKSLGFSTSPIEVLKELANNNPCYLIIDQVDAINWEQKDWNSTFEACCSIVKQCSNIKNMKLVLACRTIDANNILSFWESSAPDLSKCKIELSNLPVHTISSAITAKQFGLLSNDAKKLLTNPRNLKLYTEIIKDKDYVPTNDIIHDFIETKQQELVNKGFNSSEIKELHRFLVNKMRDNESTTLSMHILEEKFSDGIINAYRSAGVIEITHNNLIKFSHQSILDYYLVKDILDEYDKCHDASKILKIYNACPIGYLHLIQHFIEALYGEDDYLAQLDNVLSCKTLRPQIKNIAMRALKTLPSSEATNKLFIKILRNPEYGLKYLPYLLSDDKEFARCFIKQPELKKMLASSSFEDNLNAVNALICADNQYAVDILNKYIGTNASKEVQRQIIFQIDDLASSDNYFAIKIYLLKSNTTQLIHVDWKSIADNNISRLADYISIFLSTNSINYNYIDEIEHDGRLIDAIKTNPSYFYSASQDKIEREFPDTLQYDRISQYDKAHKLASEIFENSLLFVEDRELLTLIFSDKQYYSHSALRCLVHPDKKDGLSIFRVLLDCDFILKNDYRYDRQLLEIICELIKRYAPLLDDNQLKKLENQIISYKSPSLLEFAKVRFEQQKKGYYYPFFEEEQKRFLECLPAAQLSDTSTVYLNYLERKFPEKSYYTWTPERDQVDVYDVVSCIENKWQKFSKKTWHQIMSNPKTGRDDHHRMVKISPGVVAESTLHEFTSTTLMAARTTPEFFADIALSYDDLRTPFIETICLGLSESAQSENSPKNKFVAVFQKYFDITNKRISSGFVRFVRNYKVDTLWIRDKLFEIATQPDKYENETMNVWPSGWDKKLDSLSTHDLDTEKINRVQTNAITCISYILFDDKSLFGKIKSILESCMNSEHPVHLLSALDILYPILNFDKEYAIEKILWIYKKDMRTLASYMSIRILPIIMQFCPNRIYSTLLNAIEANPKGFTYVFNRIVEAYCHCGYYKKLVKRLIKSHYDICLNAAVNIALNTQEQTTATRAMKLIMLLSHSANTESKRIELIERGINNKIADNPKLRKILLNNIKKIKNYSNYNTQIYIANALQKQEHLLSIKEIIITYCAKVINSNSEYRHGFEYTIPLLIRLYTEAKVKKRKILSLKCLNIIDKIYKNHAITKEIIDKYQNFDT